MPTRLPGSPDPNVGPFNLLDAGVSPYGAQISLWDAEAHSRVIFLRTSTASLGAANGDLVVHRRRHLVVTTVLLIQGLMGFPSESFARRRGDMAVVFLVLTAGKAT